MATQQHTSVWRRLLKNRPAAIALAFLLVLLTIALLAPVIANHKPLYAVYKGQTFYPAFTSKLQYQLTDPKTGQTEVIDINETAWKEMELESVVWPLVPYSPGRSDLLNGNYRGPGDKQVYRNAKGVTEDMPSRFRHKLGTGMRGDDVLAGLLHGTRISLKVGILSMLLASILGIFLGAVAGFFGNDNLRTQRAGLWGFYLSILPAWFYSFYTRSGYLSEALKEGVGIFALQLLISILLFTSITWLFIFIFNLTLGWIKFFNKTVTIPIDTWIMRVIETVISIPGIILIIAVAAITQNLLGVIIVIIGLTGWTGIARLIRAEMLKVRELDYIIAAKAVGLKRLAIIFRHALPNAIQPALVSMVFGVASAILIESGLSFLGAFQVGDVTWGSLLAEGRNNFNAWWLVIFPGLAIFLTVTSLNLLGEALRDVMDVR